MRGSLGVGFCCLVGISNVCAVTIETAKWKTNNERLVLKGQDLALSPLVLVDADSGLPLATAEADRAGGWVAKIDAVTRDHVADFGANLCRTAQPALALYGPVASAPGHGELRDRLAA